MTDKCIALRRLEETDLHTVMIWRNRDDVRQRLFNSRLLDMEDQRRWYKSYCANDKDEMFIIMADAEPVGTIAIYGIDRENRSAEIGRMIIGSDIFRNKGYAYRGGLLLLDYAFSEIGMDRLYLELFADNMAALKLYYKLGFVEEGLLREARLTSSGRRDVRIMGLLKNEYLARKG